MNTKNSLHEQGWGQKNMVVDRADGKSCYENCHIIKKGDISTISGRKLGLYKYICTGYD